MDVDVAIYNESVIVVNIVQKLIARENFSGVGKKPL